jgi:uncharacterized SAM-binding protein YcdF (DUF218 family)
MIYPISRFFGALVQPSSLLILLCAAGLAISLWRHGSRWGRRLLLVGVGGLAACAWLPVGVLLMRPLEDRFPHETVGPRHVDGIIVLGGAIDLDESALQGTAAVNERAQRVTTFLTLARRYPGARLVFSGGDAHVIPRGPTEADIARQLFTDLGLDDRRVVFEGGSRNTHENALFSRRLVKPKAGQVWLLVTSAGDMPRAVGCFRAVGWPVTAYPADYHAQGWTFDLMPGLLPGLSVADWATHEWIGLVYYRLRGWTSSLFPAP